MLNFLSLPQIALRSQRVIHIVLGLGHSLVEKELMPEPTPNVTATQPKSVWTKPLKADWKELFKGLAKGIGHAAVGKWEELGSDAVETLFALGLTTEPGELAFLLIERSATKAIFALVGESAGSLLTEARKDEDSLIEQLDFSDAINDVQIDHRFLDRPADLPLIRDLQGSLQRWLEGHGVPKNSAAAIVQRLPSYFVYALNQEWRQKAKSYAPLLEAMNTPFTRAGEREWGWAAYAALLRRRIHESIFDEPFSLAQIFVPLNAYYLDDPARGELGGDMARGEPRRRHIVSLEEELGTWLEKVDREDAIRVISGGPGSGKSSFARMFAPHDKATTCFLLELITRLQRLGTAPAIDMAAYARWLVRQN